MQDRVAIERRKPAGAVRHEALTLGRADRLAEVRLGVQAVFAFPAFRGVERNDMIALLQAGDARAHIHHDARALMPKNGREETLGIGTRQREFVGMADAGGLDLDQNLALAGAIEIDLHHLKRFSGGNGHGCAGSHGCPPSDRLSYWSDTARNAGSIQRLVRRVSLSLEADYFVVMRWSILLLILAGCAPTVAANGTRRLRGRRSGMACGRT